ncbi:MAG: hypothetical protein HUJ66_01410 [Oscillospiraceae bacterium]|nr:hypothetical protein [Oscillospiraceae bacterium]
MGKNIIYCYSGTGNCLDIAKNIAAELGNTDIVMMRSAPELTDARGYERVGFVFPCYAGGLPAGVEDSVKSVRMDFDCYRFGVVSCAAYPGTGMHRIDKLVHLHYRATVTHQCSCIWLFPHDMMLPPMKAPQAQARSEKKAKLIGQDVKAKRATGHPPLHPLNAAESAAWPLMSRLKAKKLAVSDICVGCGQCSRLCPKGNIRMVNGRPVFGDDCLQCLSCLQYCPYAAISVGKITDRREHYHNPNITAEELMQKLIHID